MAANEPVLIDENNTNNKIKGDINEPDSHVMFKNVTFTAQDSIDLLSKKALISKLGLYGGQAIELGAHFFQRINVDSDSPLQELTLHRVDRIAESIDTILDHAHQLQVLKLENMSLSGFDITGLMSRLVGRENFSLTLSSPSGFLQDQMDDFLESWEALENPNAVQLNRLEINGYIFNRETLRTKDGSDSNPGYILSRMTESLVLTNCTFEFDLAARKELFFALVLPNSPLRQLTINSQDIDAFRDEFLAVLNTNTTLETVTLIHLDGTEEILRGGPEITPEIEPEEIPTTTALPIGETSLLRQLLNNINMMTANANHAADSGDIDGAIYWTQALTHTLKPMANMARDAWVAKNSASLQFLLGADSPLLAENVTEHQAEPSVTPTP